MCIIVKRLWVVRLVVFNYLDLLQLVVRSVSLHTTAHVDFGVYICKCCFLKNKAIPHRLDVGFATSFSPIKRESPSSLNRTSPIHLRLFVVLPNCFGYLLFASIS